MANYISSLTGQQLDDALTQVNNRVPEGWAVGEKDGVPVSSGSLYYHNNAKYYADYAQGQANRAEAAVPAGTAGAVFFDRTQALTAAQQEQARQNIKAGGSNPNLLDNPWFTVNQRGQSSYTGKVYGFDRWKTYTNTTISKTGNIIKLSNVNQGFNFFQPLREGLADFLPGRKVTFSILFADDSVLSVTDIFPTLSTTPQSIGRIDPQGNNIYVYFASAVSAAGISNPTLQLYSGNYIDMDIKAMKLELGSVSTLANDAPPNYQQELAKCQGYFVRIKAQSSGGYCLMGMGYTASATIVAVTLNIPTNMRKITSVTMSGAFKAYKLDSSANYAISSITTSNQAPGIATLAATVSGATAGLPVVFQSAGDVNAYIDLSAEP